jgi:hypothetical protein
MYKYFDYISLTVTYIRLQDDLPTKTKLHGLSLRANYTDRAAAAGPRS